MRRLVCLGGPKDREVLAVADDRWSWRVFHAPPIPARIGGGHPKATGVVDVTETRYDVAEVAMGRDQMLPAGYRSHRVLIWSGIPDRERDALLARDDRPMVDGPRKPPEPRPICFRWQEELGGRLRLSCDCAGQGCPDSPRRWGGRR